MDLGELLEKFCLSCLRHKVGNMLKILQRISQEVNAAPNMESALATVVQQVCHILQADSCSIFICDDIKGEYLLMASMGISIEPNSKVRLKYGEGLVGLVGEREEPINLDNASAHAKFFQHSKVNEMDFKGFLGVPVIEQGELLGVLIAQKTEA